MPMHIGILRTGFAFVGYLAGEMLKQVQHDNVDSWIAANKPVMPTHIGISQDK